MESEIQELEEVISLGHNSATQLDASSSVNSTQACIAPIVNKPTPWASFTACVTRHRAVVLFVFLAVLCLTTGIAVYFATLRKEWINIHLVPHSHDDVGWLRTPETYYEHTVKFILNNVIYELQKDPNRKFTYVETYFFWRWWTQQSPHTQDVVKRLVENGQLEFAGGSWTMNDEATVNYQTVIDQFSWGLRRLNDTFGEAGRPNIGWQIDTFGHSREVAALMVHMGFKGLFFARIDEVERRQRRRQQSMEFLWNDRDGATSMLTSVMYKHYNPPSGYHYEKEINEGANLDGFLEAVREWASAYQTKNVLVPMGDDFTYYDARSWYDSMDVLIRLVEERKDSVNVNMFYSTPEQYLRSIRDSPAVWPVKNGDFFPYASDIFSFWAGYFTSRPGLKLFERVSNNVLQTLKHLLAAVGLDAASEGSLSNLREALGVLLHHDAITGTSKQSVNDHYLLLLHQAVSSAYDAIIHSIGILSVQYNKLNPSLLKPCLQLNESVCSVSEHSQQFVVVAYNALSWPASHAIRLPVAYNNYVVRDADGAVVNSQIVPIPEELRFLPGRHSSTTNELVFLSGDIPPLGFTSFHIAVDTLDAITPSSTTAPIHPSVSSNISLGFHDYTGRLLRVNRDNRFYQLEQDVEYYNGAPFWTGAYVFRPENPYPYSVGPRALTKLAGDGMVVMEMQQTLGPWASQVIRAYAGVPFLEFEWLVGPIPVDDYHGKEVIIRYSTNLNSSGLFYTDTNGRGVLMRKRDSRDDWAYTVTERVSGNYYPVTSHISLRHAGSYLTVFVDRSQGGSSLADGQLELMVHRRLCYDDGKGVNEPLNETAYGKGLVVRGRHWVLQGEGEGGEEETIRRLGVQLHHPPLLLFAPTDLDYFRWSHQYLTKWGGLRAPLPVQVRVLTLEPWKDDLMLLRLEHLFEKTSIPSLSFPTTLSLKELFTAFDIVSARETKLAADRWADDSNSWLTGDHALTITLQPASIRTFLIQIIYRQSYK